MINKEFQEYLVGKTIKSVRESTTTRGGVVITFENGSEIWSGDMHVALATGIDGARYFVDERSGCIAIRDRWNTNPEYQGLHSDTEGVMVFRTGARVFDDRNNYINVITDKLRDEMLALCDKLNNERLV